MVRWGIEICRICLDTIKYGIYCAFLFICCKLKYRLYSSVEIPTRCSFVIQFIIPRFSLNAQHVSSGTPLIIGSSKLYSQPLVYMPIWWPAVTKFEWALNPLNLGNGRSPYGHINQRLQIQFRAPDDERCAHRNMLSI